MLVKKDHKKFIIFMLVKKCIKNNNISSELICFLHYNSLNSLAKNNLLHGLKACFLFVLLLIEYTFGDSQSMKKISITDYSK